METSKDLMFLVIYYCFLSVVISSESNLTTNEVWEYYDDFNDHDEYATNTNTVYDISTTAPLEYYIYDYNDVLINENGTIIVIGLKNERLSLYCITYSHVEHVIWQRSYVSYNGYNFTSSYMNETGLFYYFQLIDDESFVAINTLNNQEICRFQVYIYEKTPIFNVTYLKPDHASFKANITSNSSNKNTINFKTLDVGGEALHFSYKLYARPLDKISLITSEYIKELFLTYDNCSSFRKFKCRKVSGFVNLKENPNSQISFTLTYNFTHEDAIRHKYDYTSNVYKWSLKWSWVELNRPSEESMREMNTFLVTSLIVTLVFIILFTITITIYVLFTYKATEEVSVGTTESIDNDVFSICSIEGDEIHKLTCKHRHLKNANDEKFVE